MTAARLRVGAPREAAAAPLVFDLDAPPWSDRVALELGTPAEVADGLAYGALDLALVPLTAWAEHAARLEIVPGLAVGSDGGGGVARLDHRVPLPEIRRIGSRARGHAAEALARTLFRSAGSDPEIVPWDGRAADALGVHDAVLSAGDGLLGEPPPPGAASLDLGRAWHELTGLAVVWSAWALPAGTLDRPLYALLHTVRTRARHDLAVVAARWAAAAGLDAGACERLVRHEVSYRLGRRQAAGWDGFATAARRQGVLSLAPPLRLARLGGTCAVRDFAPAPRRGSRR